MDCFNNIIGISRTDATCFTAAFNDAARVSVSGLYLDEAEGFPALEIFRFVASGEGILLQALLEKARTRAIDLVKEELSMELGIRYPVKSQSYIDYAGQISGLGTINFTMPYAALVLEMRPYRGAIVKVTGVLPQFTTTTNLEVKVYQAYNNGNYYQVLSELETLSIPIAPNPTLKELSLELPTTDEVGRAYSYLFVYATAGITARDNSNSCGCGGKENIRDIYLKPYSVVGASYDNMLISNRGNKINGLLLQVDARCNGGNFLCENYYNNSLIATAMNHAIQRKSAATALVSILTSDIINRYTMAKREQIGNTINILNSKVKKSVSWIAENLDLSNNDCYICNPGGSSGAYEITVGKILV